MSLETGKTLGRHLVKIQPLPASTSKQIHVVLNGFDELKRLVPTQ